MVEEILPHLKPPIGNKLHENHVPPLSTEHDSSPKSPVQRLIGAQVLFSMSSTKASKSSFSMIHIEGQSHLKTAISSNDADDLTMSDKSEYDENAG